MDVGTGEIGQLMSGDILVGVRPRPVPGENLLVTSDTFEGFFTIWTRKGEAVQSIDSIQGIAGRAAWIVEGETIS